MANISIRQRIKQAFPTPIWHVVNSARYAVQRAAQWPEATFHPLRRSSIQLLSAYKDAYRGERCFIIGNGPSLKNMDLSRLHNEVTFGMNRIYLQFPELGFTTTYFVTVNNLVIEQFTSDILGLSIPRFLAWHAHKHLGRQAVVDSQVGIAPVIFLHTTYTGPKFARDALGRLWEGATVTYVTMQLAYYMGFETVILIGVDHNYTTKGKPNTTVVSQGDDPDHFNARYFGKGLRWQLPDLDTSEQAYLMARQAFESDGRQVLDATVGGQLTVFPKVSYDDLF